MCGVVREGEGMYPAEVVDVVREMDLGVMKLAGLPNVGKVVWPRHIPGVTVEDGSPL